MTHPTTTPRQRWMAILARADGPTLAALLAAAPPLPPWQRLRGPEAGLVMMRGRAGGDGEAFNLGEATVARCAVSMAGRIGHGWRLGRDLRAAELSAALDAALQDDELRPALEEAVLAPLGRAQDDAAEVTSRRAAATEVRFFTLAAMR